MQYGHFDNKSREYVIDRVDLPVSWTNYIGVGDMYGVFNHTACRWTAPGTISTSVTTISTALRNSGTISSAAFRYQRPMRV